MKTNYSISENIDHGRQGEAESIAWQDSLARFQTDREREAYRAGYRAGWSENRAAITIHAPLSMRDSLAAIFYGPKEGIK